MPLSFGKIPMGDSVFHKIHMTFPMEKAVQIQTKVSGEEQKNLQPLYSTLQRKTTGERAGGTFFLPVGSAEGKLTRAQASYRISFSQDRQKTKADLDYSDLKSSTA